MQEYINTLSVGQLTCIGNSAVIVIVLALAAITLLLSTKER